MKEIKLKIRAMFRGWRRVCFEDKKRILPPEKRPKSLVPFEKRAPGHEQKFVLAVIEGTGYKQPLTSNSRSASHKMSAK